MASSKTAARPNRPMQILSLGMAKTGTASMAEAYRVLGYQDMHHGLQCVIKTPQDFAVCTRAADSCFPYLNTYTGQPFTRTDWDKALGPCEAVADIASFFAPSLIAAYPEAKVVLVERDVEAWDRSMDPNLVMTLGPMQKFFHSLHRAAHWVHRWTVEHKVPERVVRSHQPY